MIVTDIEQSSGAAQRTLLLEFGAHRERIPAGEPFVIGRAADLSIGDNPYVHRRFLEIAERDGVWWLTNVGSGLTASAASADGLAQSWLAPGATMPLVFSATTVMFTAGEITYELALTADTPYYEVSASWRPGADSTDVSELLSPVQRILLSALAEPMLRQGMEGAVQLPSMAQVASRLGWSMEKTERRVGSLCSKFGRLGIRGLERNADGELLASARSRIVEHAVGARIVTPADLELLDAFVAQDAFATV